jgi:(4-(4-[2-(gamma-L-glutamylamino)ethyl]phenoxymethyl)furan-2-yl)methanamine synthase
MKPGIMGWDIGGVNTKAARLEDSGLASRSVCFPYELQREPAALGSVLRSAAAQLEGTSGDRHAITMTAELSQAFRTKREGIAYVLDAVESVFPANQLHVYTVSGGFVSPGEARNRTFDVAASNWSATAHWVARSIPTCLLIDIGSTTADLIPIVGGQVVAAGRTDPERLRSGELVYTGVLRTPVEAVGRRVPLGSGTAGLAAEGFAIMGDVHLWLGHLTSDQYTCATPDGRPATREYAGERLARAVCADREMLDSSALEAIARTLAVDQLHLLVGALTELRRRQPVIDTAVLTGLGDFLAAEAARCIGLEVVSLRDQLGSVAITAPAAAVACLLQQKLEGGT